MRALRPVAKCAIALGALAIVASACGNPAAKVASNPRVKIGVILSLTGSDAPLGTSQREAIGLAVKQFAASPGPRFQPTIIDESAGATGVSKLISHGVAAVVGPTHSSFATSVYSLLDIAEVPVLGISLTVPGLTAFRPFLWRVSLAADRTIPPSVSAATSASSGSTAYLIYSSNDLYTVAEQEIFQDTLTNDGIALLGQSSFLSGQQNLSPVITAAKAAGASIICVSAEAKDAVRILQQLRAAGMNQIVVGGNGFNSSSVVNQAGTAANNLYVGAAWDASKTSASSRSFETAFKNAYGTFPDEFAAEAYAGMQVLRAAVRKGGPTRAGIQDGFAHLGVVQTILGPFSFDISRDAVYPAVVYRIENGKLIGVK